MLTLALALALALALEVAVVRDPQSFAWRATKSIANRSGR
jgi:hypothetical protein